MRKRMKDGTLVFCLFTFLLIVLGGGLRLNPGGALMAAATGTPLLIYVFRCFVIRPTGFANQRNEDEACYDGEPGPISHRG